MSHDDSDNAQALVLEQLLRARHSCRGFLPEAVPRAMQLRILELAQRSASWCNAQPWQVHVTEGMATDRLRENLLAPVSETEPGPDFEWPRAYRGVYRQRRFDCAMQLYDSLGIASIPQAALAARPQRVRDFFGLDESRLVICGISFGYEDAMHSANGFRTLRAELGDVVNFVSE